MPILYVLHVFSVVGLVIIGLNTLIVALLYWRHNRLSQPPGAPPAVDDWPHVVIQLPIYNERFVVEQLIEVISCLDYPRDRLTVQLLDDSDDETVEIAVQTVAHARQQGLDVRHIRRPTRTGYKAGALAYGLTLSDAPYVAVFDADFIPPPDFLKRSLPPLLRDQRVGLVQARWTPHNRNTNLVTLSMSLPMDAHFIVEQTAQDQARLLMNFTGSAGVWRRAAIDEAGGWSADTLSEDLDLSYRAQLRGWRFMYLPDLVVEAEYPTLMMALKRQQARWATGTLQCLLKLTPHVLRSDLNPLQKLMAMLRLGAYFAHPLILLFILTTLPLLAGGALTRSVVPLLFAIALAGPPIQMLMAQLDHGRWSRMVGFPLYLLMGFGLIVNNTLAMITAFTPQGKVFKRTPKVKAADGHGYAIPLDYTTLLEGLMAAYTGLATVVAWQRAPSLVPVLAFFTLGLLFIAGGSIWQTLTLPHQHPREEAVPSEA